MGRSTVAGASSEERILSLLEKLAPARSALSLSYGCRRPWPRTDPFDDYCSTSVRTSFGCESELAVAQWCPAIPISSYEQNRGAVSLCTIYATRFDPVRVAFTEERRHKVPSCRVGIGDRLRRRYEGANRFNGS